MSVAPPYGRVRPLPRWEARGSRPRAPATAAAGEGAIQAWAQPPPPGSDGVAATHARPTPRMRKGHGGELKLDERIQYAGEWVSE